MQSNGKESREAGESDPARPILLAKASGSTASQIGGKAASLVRLAASGCRVPDGVVFPAAWFSRWWEELRATEAWASFARAQLVPQVPLNRREEVPLTHFL